MYDITALGELLIDFTPFGTSDNGQKLFEQNPGGAPVNVLATAGNLGLKTAFIGKVGSDMHGLFLKNILEKRKIETSGLLVDDQYFTTLAFVDLNESGERTFSFCRKNGADTMLTKEEVKVSLIENSRLFHVGSLSLTSDPAKTATLFALEKAIASKCIISYDPNYRASLWENETVAIKEMKSLIPFCNIMKISDEETNLLTPHKDIEAAATYLNEQGVEIVVVTLGGKGSYIKTKEGGIYASGFHTTVVDTTGAGDAFFGSFLFKILNSNQTFTDLTLKTLQDFALFANACASLCIEKRGSVPAIPSYDDIEKRYSTISFTNIL